MTGHFTWDQHAAVRDSAYALAGGLLGRFMAGGWRIGALARDSTMGRYAAQATINYTQTAKNMVVNTVVNTYILAASWSIGNATRGRF